MSLATVPANPPAGQPAPFVSVIVPAYNEERRLADSLKQIQAYFEARNYLSEVIVVDDGSVDRTAHIVEESMRMFPALRLVRATHGGKGHACKQGVLASRGEWLFLCDSDLSMPIEEFAKFEPLFDGRYEIVIASREAAGARRHGEPKYRHWMGRVFNWLVRTWAVRDIQDTQCGFKSFRAGAAKTLFGKQTIDGLGFDVEVLFIAQKRGYRIAEVPINWHYRTHSKVKPVQDTVNMVREVWRVRSNDWRKVYDD